MLRVCPQCDQKYPEDREFCAKDGTRLEEFVDDTSDPLIGRVLDGRWVIDKRIGMGGMGAVYLGSQRSVDREVAIKTLKPELCSSREFVERFFREARVATKISHPNCVTILDFGQTADDTLYLAMEYLDGMELSERLNQGALTVREIVEICIQISSALAAAHASNIIHRDLKPDNIYLLSISDESIFIKVLDFGIAKVLDSEEKMTRTGQVFGTPEYMSPEQCRGDTIDGRSDLYSLGCIMYRMLVDRPPFESDTPMAVLVSHVSEVPTDVREVMTRDDIPEALADLCMRLLSKDADRRPADAQSVRGELESILDLTSTQANQAIASATGPTQAAPAVAADGGNPVPDASAPASPNAARSAELDRKDSQKTASPDGTTHPPGKLDAPKKSKVLPAVLGLLLLLVLGSGCVLGTYFFVFQSDDSDAQPGNRNGFLASIFGGDDPEKPLAEKPLAEKPLTPDSDPSTPKDNSDDSQELPADKSNPGQDQDPNADNTVTDSLAAPGPPDAPTAEQKGAGDETNPTVAPDQDEDDTPKSDPTKDDSNSVTINADEVNISDNSASPDPSKDKPKNPTNSKTDKSNKPAPPKKPAASGTIRRAKLSVTGAACLEPDVDKVLKSANRRFLLCYQKQLDPTPEAAGKIMMSFNITPDGTLLTPSVQVSDISAMNSCMIGQLKQLNFAPALGGRCYVRVTYNFSP